MPLERLPGTVAACAVAAVLVLAGAAPAEASGPPQSGGGIGHVTGSVDTSVRTAGQNRIVERRATGVVSGSLDGTFVEEQRGVVHADGTVTYQGTLVFTGVVAGCGQGTVSTHLQGRGQALPPITDGTITVVDGGSNTVPVHGHGTISQRGLDVVYAIQYTCG
jgi:hypothetical protein